MDILYVYIYIVCTCDDFDACLWKSVQSLFIIMMLMMTIMKEKEVEKLHQFSQEKTNCVVYFLILTLIVLFQRILNFHILMLPVW